jgi:thiamine-phosphate pyrophosphorylase
VSSRRYLEAGREVLDLCRAEGVPLLINDRPDVALGAGADGAHVGPGDLPPLSARRILGEGLLGVSARTVERVRLAETAGADYLGVGALRGSVTKPEAVPLGLGGIAALLRSTSLPAVVIGGVQPADVPILRGEGAAGVAVLSGIMNAPDPEAAARAYREAWERA